MAAKPSGQDRSARYLVSNEQLDELLLEMLEAGIPTAIARTFTTLVVTETVTDAWCKNCNEPVKVRYPDWRGYRQLAELILNYLRGKPTEKKQVDISHRLIRRRDDLEALSDEELLAIEEREW